MAILLFPVEDIHKTVAELGEGHKGMVKYKRVASTLLSWSPCKDELIYLCSYGEKYSSSACYLLFTPSTDLFVYVELVIGETNFTQFLIIDHKLLLSANKFVPAEIP